MKLRKGFIVGMVSLLGVTGLAGCKKKGEDVTLKKVSINGIQRTYEEGDTIDWSALSVTATYSDASTTTFTKFEFDVNSVASSETQAVVYTSGLHDQTSLVEGVYAISVAFPSDLSTKHPAGNIAVGNATPDSYALVECSDPTLKTGYETNTRGAGTAIEPERDDKEVGKANENKFISSNTQYVVGTMNPFIYEPEVSFENLADPTAELISGDDIHFRKDFSVKVLSGSNYIDAPADDYAVVNNNIKFNESAIGKTFSLTVSLHDFEFVEGTTKKAESTFEGFTVQKGLNIYNAKQLGILNISNMTTAQLNEKYFVEHHGDPDKMVWNGTTYVKAVYNEMWRDFLLSSGTFTSAELQAYADVPAIFLQRKIELKPSDIPSDYFIKRGELSGDRIVGCLRDGMNIYLPVVDSNDVEINGNFWTFDTTAIPLCKNERSGNDGPQEYIEGSDKPIMPGHSSVIEFCGIELNDDDFKAQRIKSTGKGIIRNINSIGNTGTDLAGQGFDALLTLTGLIFVKNDYCGAVYDNCILKQYQIGVFPDNNVGQAYDGAAQVDRTFVNQTRMYDCANSGVFNYHNGGTSVTKSVFNRFGATPIMNAGSVKEYLASNTNVKSDVIFNNEITGEELYFSALGATEAVGVIKAFNPLFEELGNKFLYTIKDSNNQDIQVMNLVSIGINGDDYLAADSPAFYSNVYLNSDSTNKLQASVNGSTMQWGLFSAMHDTIYAAKYAEAYAENWSLAQQQHAAKYAQEYAANWAYAQNAFDIEARNFILDPDHRAMFPGITDKTKPEEIPEDYVNYVKANDDFVNGFNTQWMQKFGFPYSELTEQNFKAFFDVAFEVGWKEEAGFDFNEESFKEYFDKVFEAQFEDEYQQPPVFQTEIATELFWSDAKKFYTATFTDYTTQLEGNYLHLLAPVGTTCLSLVFRIGKLPAPQAQ